MAQVELDSFVSKLKSLWLSGFSAKLHVETEGGKVSVRLEADLGYAPPPRAQAEAQPRGPAYRRRQERRRGKRLNVVAVNPVETHAVGAEAIATASSVHDNPEATEQVESAKCDHSNIDKEDSNPQLDELRSKIVELEKEIELKNNTIAVNDMLFEDFKERVQIKYLYDSNDEESEYEPDDEKRELSRLEFWQKKLEERRKKYIAANKNVGRLCCKECDFTAKSEQGLKTHIQRKH